MDHPNADFRFDRTSGDDARTFGKFCFMAGQENIEYARLLGAEIRNRRLARGLSLRALAKQLNLSGHGTLVDYELGRRIPPANLVEGCERVFEISDGTLRNLREKALAERANVRTAQLRAPEEIAEPARRSTIRRWPVAIAAAAVLIAAGVVVWQWRTPGPPPVSAASAGPVKFGFEDGIERWSPFWGGEVLNYDTTEATAYQGKRSLQLTTTEFSNTRDKAIGTTHGLTGLHPGMKVTYYLRVPVPERASVRFFAYDSKSNPTWAKETPKGGEAALPTDSAWKRYVWTVPKVDVVHGIGLEIYQFTKEPVIVWLDAISW